MNKKESTVVMVFAVVAWLIMNLAVVALTGWVFSITGSAWSFLILLFLSSMSTNSKSNY